MAIGLVGPVCMAQLGPKQVIHQLDRGTTGTCIVLDADGDGDDDIVNSVAPVCRILVNDGSGGFDDRRSLFDSTITSVLFAAEANGDGLEDLFIRQGNSFAFALSDGAGDFQPVPGPYDDLNDLICVAADIDGNGISDVICSRPSNNDIVLLTNDGNGHVGGPTVLATSSYGAQLPSVGDVDGDGDEDVLAVFGTTAALLLNLEGGVFDHIAFPTAFPRQGAIADMDQDGLKDVLMSQGSGFGPRMLILWRSIGGGLFDPPDTVDFAFRPNATFHVEDLDGDDFPDLYYGEGDTLKWYRNNGSGGLLPSMPMVSGFMKAYWKVDEQWTIDRDNDGDRDILVRLRDGPHSCIVEQNSPGSFSEVPHWLIGSWTIGGVEAADVDGDMDPDLITFGYSVGSFNAEVINLFRNDGTTDLAPRELISDSAITVLDMALTDLDMDGDQDVVYSSWVVRTVFWLENDGTGHFAPRQVCLTGDLQPWRFDVSDVNADGAPDLMVIYTGQNVLHLFLNDGNGHFGAAQLLSTTLNWPHEIKCADMDGDGDKDAVIADGTYELNNQVMWLANDGTGDFPGPLMDVSTPGEVAKWLAIADLDNDGDNDVVYDRFVDNSLVHIRMAINDGQGSFAPSTLASITDALSDLRFSDMTSDGLPDLLLSGDSGPFAYLMINAGGGSFIPPLVLTDQQSGPEATLAADLDLDGLPDLVTASSMDQQLSWYENPGITTSDRLAFMETLAVLPNPVSEVASIHFSASLPSDARVELMDVNGRMVRSLKGNGSRQLVLERSGLACGMYMLKVVGSSTPFIPVRILID